MRSCAFIKGLRVVGKISLMDERMRRILLSINLRHLEILNWFNHKGEKSLLLILKAGYDRCLKALTLLLFVSRFTSKSPYLRASLLQLRALFKIFNPLTKNQNQILHRDQLKVRELSQEAHDWEITIEKSKLPKVRDNAGDLSAKNWAR